MSLRSYTPMRRTSEKVRKGEGEFQAVYRLVDQRSEGRCEYESFELVGLVHVNGTLIRRGGENYRCPKRATDHHHTVKPRRSNHEAALIVHLCRAHHDRCEWPFDRGRLVVTALGEGRFSFVIAFERIRA